MFCNAFKIIGYFFFCTITNLVPFISTSSSLNDSPSESLTVISATIVDTSSSQPTIAAIASSAALMVFLLLVVIISTTMILLMKKIRHSELSS